MWKRCKQTSEIVQLIREAILKAGFEEEFAITPLATTYSVVARKGEEFFNVRLAKDTLEMNDVVSLNYIRRKNQTVKVFRNILA